MRWRPLLPVAAVSAALGCAAAVGIVTAFDLGGGEGTTVVQQTPLKRILPELEKKGRVERGYVGLDAVTIDEALADLGLPAERGALVQSVAPGGPADEAGIRGGTIVAQLDGSRIRLGGDIVTAVDGRKIETGDALAAAITAKSGGDKVKVELLRDGRRRTVEVTLAQRPTSQAQGSG